MMTTGPRFYRLAADVLSNSVIEDVVGIEVLP